MNAASAEDGGMSGRARKAWYDPACENLAEHFLRSVNLDHATLWPGDTEYDAYADHWIRVPLSAILSVDPRLLKVGDRVRVGSPGSAACRIVAIVADEAALVWDDSAAGLRNGKLVNNAYLLSSLTRLPEGSTPDPEPQFKPGDEVEAALDISGTLQVGLIIAISGDDAWVHWGDHFGRRTEPLDTLTRRGSTP